MAVRTVQEVVLKRQACENNKKRMNIIKVRNWLKTLILMWSVPALLIGIWIYLSMTNQLNHLFPRPSELIQTTASLIADGTLAANIQISLLRAGAGLAAGGTIGFVLGTLTGQFRLFDTILNTPIQMIKSVPRLAILPLILIWFGLGETAKVVLIALSTFCFRTPASCHGKPYWKMLFWVLRTGIRIRHAVYCRKSACWAGKMPGQAIYQAVSSSAWHWHGH